VTVTLRAVRRYDHLERAVYRAAVELAEQCPAGFDAAMLARTLNCSEAEAARWVEWLRKTGDFAASGGPAEH
jgi:hypothetical protein